MGAFLDQEPDPSLQPHGQGRRNFLPRSPSFTAGVSAIASKIGVKVHGVMSKMPPITKLRGKGGKEWSDTGSQSRISTLKSSFSSSGGLPDYQQRISSNEDCATTGSRGSFGRRDSGTLSLDIHSPFLVGMGQGESSRDAATHETVRGGSANPPESASSERESALAQRVPYTTMDVIAEACDRGHSMDVGMIAEGSNVRAPSGGLVAAESVEGLSAGGAWACPAQVTLCPALNFTN